MRWTSNATLATVELRAAVPVLRQNLDSVRLRRSKDKMTCGPSSATNSDTMRSRKDTAKFLETYAKVELIWRPTATGAAQSDTWLLSSRLETSSFCW